MNTAGGGFERLGGQKLAFALCVYTKASSINSPEIGLPFRPQTNGLFIKLKALSPLGNIQFQQLAWRVKSLPPVHFALSPNNALMCEGPLMGDKASVNWCF